MTIDSRADVESGKYRAETRDGRPARVICWDRKCIKPIVALIPSHTKEKIQHEHIVAFYPNGCYFNDPTNSPDDLFLVDPSALELTEFEHCLKCVIRDCAPQVTVRDSSIKCYAKTLLDVLKEESK